LHFRVIQGSQGIKIGGGEECTRSQERDIPFDSTLPNNHPRLASEASPGADYDRVRILPRERRQEPGTGGVVSKLLSKMH
jgi:hypothetical protein